MGMVPVASAHTSLQAVRHMLLSSTCLTWRLCSGFFIVWLLHPGAAMYMS